MAIKERLPSKKADDDEERSLANWIANNKKKELGTDSKREQLLRREVSQVFT
jgi:hypothetical protein